VLSFTLNGYRVTSRPPEPRRTPPSEEVLAAQRRADFHERLHRAVITAAKEAWARGEIFDGITFEREVVQAGEL
jgi:hypothetical protein